MLTAASLFLLATEAQSNELDNLINASSAIVSQIDKGIKLAGAGYGYANVGGALSNGQLAGTAHISTEQLNAYNAALGNMDTYQAYGDVQALLEAQAANELQLMDAAIEEFTDVVVDMIAVVEIAEISEEAETPDDKAAVQEYVLANEAALTITSDEVDTYNQSLDDIEEHGNNASAYLGVAGNEEAVAFLQQGAEDNNSNADLGTLTFSQDQAWVSLAYAGTNNANAVYLDNRQGSFGMDFYVSEADILAAGAQSELYLTGPTALGYRCFMFQEDCDP
tara:strand:- start:2191 stop:3027 length:837 start_codon:yes stop_codon:yes gene_type:complete